MGRATFARWAGLAAMTGGALATGAFAVLASRPEGVPGGPYRDADDVGPFLVAALTCIGIGVIGLHARQGGRGGRLGATGLALGLAGAGILVLTGVLLATLGDVLAALLLRGPALLALLAGSALSALAGLRTGAVPRAAALVVVAGSLVFLAFDLESDRLWFALPFGVAWVWVGYALWSGWRGPVAATPPGHSGGGAVSGGATLVANREKTWRRRAMRAVTREEAARRGRVRAASWGVAAPVAGGLLWIPFGCFEMLRPWGLDRAFREDRGYEVVLDAALYRAYALPGALAATLTALGLLGLVARLGLPATRAGRAARALGWLAAGLGAVSAAGVLLLFDPLFTGLRLLSTVALGSATILAGLAARRVPAAAGWAGPLLALGLLGLALFPLWPVVYALAWLTPATGAATIGLFGLGWALAGARLATMQPTATDEHPEG